MIRTLRAAAPLLALSLALGASAQPRITIPTSALEQEKGGDAARISIQGNADERVRLREMLLEWRTYVQEGNVADAGEVVGQMKELLAFDGVKDQESILAAFVAMGHDWTGTKSWDPAERAFKAALELDPSYGPARLGQAELVRERDGGVGGWLGLFAGVVQSFKSRLTDRLGVVGVTSNVLLLVVVAMAVTIGGVAFVLLLRNSRLLVHGVSEALSQRVPAGVDRVIGWVLVFLPMIAWMSPPWWVLWWLALLSGYGPASLRRLAIIALVVAALLPVAYHFVSLVSSLQVDPVLRAEAGLDRRDVATRDIQDVGSIAQSTSDPNAWFLLGLLQSAAARPDDAIESYSSSLARDSSDVRPIINRANIHFRRGDITQAIADYKLATDTDRQSALAWRNGAIAYAQNLQANTSTEWVQKAQQLDRGAVQDWAEVHGADRVVDARLTMGEVLRLVRKTRPDFGIAAIFRTILNPLSIAALVALAHAVYRSRRGLGALEAASCEKCGRAFCSRCHAAAKSSAYCTQCVHLYVKKDGVSPVVRAKKVKEVERHVAVSNIAVRLFNLVLPGAGSMLANRTISGTVTMLIWGGTLAALLMPTRLLMERTRIGHADLSVLFAVELAILVLVYIAALLQALRHSS